MTNSWLWVRVPQKSPEAKVGRGLGRKCVKSVAETQHGIVELARRSDLIEKVGIMRDRTSLVRLKSRSSIPELKGIASFKKARTAHTH